MVRISVETISCAFERVKREIREENMTEMILNKSTDVLYNRCLQAFFKGAARLFQQDNESENTFMIDREERESQKLYR